MYAVSGECRKVPPCGTWVRIASRMTGFRKGLLLGGKCRRGCCARPARWNRTREPGGSAW